MSSIYIHQPKTSGKVFFKTTFGEIRIELWPKECPKACRNFVQLCLEGYYDNNIIHKIVPTKFIQSGDPTNTGDGGESIYTDSNGNSIPFEIETHSRLKFISRGMVACASEDGFNQNKSQFFITLGKCDELNFKHTIFGKVVDNSIFNVIRISNLEINDNGVPLYPPHIVSCEVIENPFSDIIVRKKKEKEKEGNEKKGGKINFSLLSFIDDDDDEGEDGMVDNINSENKVTYSSFFEKKGKEGTFHVRKRNNEDEKKLDEIKSRIRMKINSDKVPKINQEKENVEENNLKKKKDIREDVLKKRKRNDKDEKDSNKLGKLYLEIQRKKFKKNKKKKTVDFSSLSSLLPSRKIKARKLEFKKEEKVDDSFVDDDFIK